MALLRAENIYDVIKPIHVSSQIIGLTSFTIKADNRLNFRASLSYINVLCITLMTAWFGIIFMCFLLVDTAWEVNREYISEFFENIVTVNICCDVAIIVTTSWLLLFLRNKLMSILNILRNIDDCLINFGAKIDYSKHKMTLITLLIATKLFNTGGIMISYVVAHLTDIYLPNLLSSLAELAGYEMYTMFFLQLILFMWAVKLRYQYLNQCLMEFYEMKKLDQDLDSQEIMKFATINDKLVTIVEKLSFCYGMPVS
jgi:hypothetical protein